MVETDLPERHRGIRQEAGGAGKRFAMKLLFDLERPELAAQIAPPYRATQIFKSVYQRWTQSFEEMTDLPKAARAQLSEMWRVQPPSIHRRFDSTDGTRRYLVP